VFQIAITGLYGTILIANMIANEYTADAEEKRKHQIEYVKTASTKVKELLDKISDKEAKKKVERIYDEIHSSPVKSSPNLFEIENSIILYINELDAAVSAGNNGDIISLANSLLLAVNNRNARLKTING
jgi:hypothetical protein